jgi:hypothetical protein
MVRCSNTAIAFRNPLATRLSTFSVLWYPVKAETLRSYHMPNAVVLKYIGSVDPLTILYTLEDPLPLQHVYTCLYININTTIYTGFTNEWRWNHLANPSNSEVRICERSCHIQRKIEIKPRTAINNKDSRLTNKFCEIFKIYNVVFLLCSFSFHMHFRWKKKQIIVRTPWPSLADTQGSADHHLRNSVLMGSLLQN